LKPASAGSIPFAERPESKRLLELLKPGDIIVSPKLDRMFRSALDALQTIEELKRRKVSLLLLDLS
jgi:DNA invertase Pin-like site-specific DNA recombinase